MKKLILTIATAALFVAACHQSVKGNYASLEPKSFAKVADSLTNEQLVDVRTPSEYAAGHLEGATNLDWNGGQFQQEAGKLDKSKPVMLYCRTGGRSTEAAEWLKKEGFTNVYEMKSGITGWQAESLPVSAETKTETAPAQELTGEITTAAYRQLVNSQEIVLVDFAATWCGPCKRLSPLLDELEKEMAGQFKLVKLDTDRDARLADSMKITALPTLYLYKNGKVQWRNEGLVEKEVVSEQIKKAQKK
ncbi:MAG: thioredoxin domain-containing protein [Bacteroidota bacterium]|nr:thioredoxin domain-containing protein [Bacteroidota bacterium]